MEDKKIAKMTEMLLGGGKMLSVHCGACKGPLFQFKGKVMCPVCGEKAKVAKAEVKPKAAPTEKVESVLRTKLNSLAEELAKETDHTKTLELLDRVKSILEVLEKLRGG
ncbi:MAG: Sjogren's syndrome/scleroderma autoantigen 1 family protein [Candidatus Hadarchaeaceae archaeon]